ncbi:ankyrin, partial [Periconia macrospinosa]
GRADINAKNYVDQTPLFLAAARADEKIVQLLLEKRGIEIDARNSNGYTPLSVAAVNGYEKVVTLL